MVRRVTGVVKPIAGEEAVAKGDEVGAEQASISCQGAQRPGLIHRVNAPTEPDKTPSDEIFVPLPTLMGQPIDEDATEQRGKGLPNPYWSCPDCRRAVRCLREWPAPSVQPCDGASRDRRSRRRSGHRLYHWRDGVSKVHWLARNVRRGRLRSRLPLSPKPFPHLQAIVRTGTA
jgi:hypothetical protein